MMDDLKFQCETARNPVDTIRFSDEEFGKVYVAIFDADQHAEIIMSKEDSTKLRDWLIEYLK